MYLAHSVSNRFLPLLVMALLLFGPKRSILGMSIESLDIQSITSIIVIAYAVFKCSSQGRNIKELFPKPFGQIGGGLLTLLFWVILVTILNGGVDLFYPLRTARATVTFVACAVFTWWWADLGLSADSLLKAIFWFLVVQAIVIIAEILSSQVRYFVYEYWSGYTPSGPEWVRAPGLIIGLAYTSVIQLIGLTIGLLYIHKTRGIEKALSIVAISLVGISLVFSGRTGLVLGFTIAPILLFRRKGMGLVTGVPVILLMLVVGGVIFSLLDEIEGGIIWDWAFEWLPSTDNAFPSTNADSLVDHWFAPKTGLGLLIGSSRIYHQQNSDDSMLVATDIGYVAFLHGIGIPGMVLSSLSYIIFLVFGWRWRRTSPVQAWCVLAAAIIFSIGNAKEVMFLTRWGWELSVLLMGALILKQREYASVSLEPTNPPLDPRWTALPDTRAEST